MARVAIGDPANANSWDRPIVGHSVNSCSMLGRDNGLNNGPALRLHDSRSDNYSKGHSNSRHEGYYGPHLRVAGIDTGYNPQPPGSLMRRGIQSPRRVGLAPIVSRKD